MAAALAMLPAGGAAANPLHPTVTHGSASFSSHGSTLTIHTSSQAAINWGSFNIGTGESTIFVQPSSSSLVLNQISDANPSQILGHLNANGYIILENPHGFYVGGQASIRASGLTLTTAPVAPIDVFGGGPWNFDAPPPAASIINYGKIQCDNGAPLFLIAHDIENHGEISDPRGNIGLFAGKEVMVSTRPDGRGVSAEVTLPQGSVDNTGSLIADAGTIAIHAQVVNQGGMIQANSVRSVNGVIEVVAADSLNLGAASSISASGDAQSVSAGGTITLQSGNTFSDATGSKLSVAGGGLGGNGGTVEISAPSMPSIHSSIDGHANNGSTGGGLLIDPSSIELGDNSSYGGGAGSGTVGSGDSPSALKLNVGDASGAGSAFTGFSQIDLQAAGSITIDDGTAWNLSASTGQSGPGCSLTLESGGAIALGKTIGASIVGGPGWTINLEAGRDFTGAPGTVTAGTGTITLAGNSSLQTQDGAINILAGQNVTLSASSSLSSASGNISVATKAGNITLGNGGIGTGLSGTINLSAGGATGNVTTGAGSVQTADGSIDVTAGNNVTVGSGGMVSGGSGAVSVTATGGTVNVGAAALQTQSGALHVNAGQNVTVTSGAIRTLGGGEIDVSAGGNINSGQNKNGYNFKQIPVSGYISTETLGGISTAAGGDVNITAGGSVTSYLPTGNSANPTDAGSGAFGPEPGVVTVTAGGNITGHFVAANSVRDGAVVASSLTSLNGSVGTATAPVALSLVLGGWDVRADAGSINLQEVRNPNGDFLNSASGAGYTPHLFNYDPNSFVDLEAPEGGVFLGVQSSSAPRYNSDAVPAIYPPNLTINAGEGGVTLENNVILFPSATGQLKIDTTGSLDGANPSETSPDFSLTMSDSGARQWQNSQTFGSTDHASTPIHLGDSQPAVIDVGGNCMDIGLFMPKVTQITVGGQMENVSFTGQNLSTSDKTTINVTGAITEENTYSFATLPGSGLPLPPPLYPGAVADYLQVIKQAIDPATQQLLTTEIPALNNLFYLPGSHKLGYIGVLDPTTAGVLEGTFQDKTYLANGVAVKDAAGNYVTKAVTFAGAGAIAQLLADAANVVNTSKAATGFVIGGPGELDISAESMDLGSSVYGLSSVGPGDNPALIKIAKTAATINLVLTGGDLSLFASYVSSQFRGGDINIHVLDGSIDAGSGAIPGSETVPHGIWASGLDDSVNVYAQGDIDVSGARIAAYDGGDVLVESYTGDVDAGNGDSSQVNVPVVVVNPATLKVSSPQEPVSGSGILAATLQDANPSVAVGNITILTPQGNVNASQGGVIQIPQNGNTSTRPTVTIEAGTRDAQTGAVIDPGDINAGNSGIIGVNTVLNAAGNIAGLVIAQFNSTINAAANVSGTFLAGGTASFNAGGTVSGIAIAGGAINVGGGKFEGVALAQNVSGGGAVSGLASQATASATSQTAAAQQSDSQKTETSDALAASTPTDDDEKKKHGRPLLAKYTGRVTVILPGAK